ncbi:MAG: [protein-PII] uridylyltransferase [Proteobacteria bacterium]|nr:[protein-PII] uridylyltransferase [Pseudomonadota bacterium]
MVEDLLYPLWDLKFDVGHAVRTTSQCLGLIREDFSSLVSFMDGRLLAGDAQVFDSLNQTVLRWLGARNRRRDFFKELQGTIAERHRKYGQTPYLLEPNVKEGQGGLRDIHAIIWGGRGVYDLRRFRDMAARDLLPADKAEELKEAHGFMACVRTYLHSQSDKKADTLTFDLQEETAAFLGYQGNGRVSGVERFMRDYYLMVYKTRSTLDYFLSRIGEDLRPSKVWRQTSRGRTVEKGLAVRRGRVELASSSYVQKRPVLMMRAFETAMSEGLQISQSSLEIIRTNLDRVDEDFRRDPEAARSFLRALAAVPPRSVTGPRNLEAMQDVNLLAAYIPELGEVRARVQHDAYHVYTVDIHLVHTLWELKKMAAGVVDEDGRDSNQEIFKLVEDPSLLCLAALLHDIGKGQGSGHAVRGAEIVRPIGERLGLSPESVETLSFLVAEHLFLADTATRRDLSEEKLIVGAAQRIEAPDRLHMLYLLTIADARATGPGAWNQWKASLVQDLYVKVLHVLTKSGLAGREQALRYERLKSDVTRLMAGRLTADEVEGYFETMSAHYLSVMEAEQIVGHILMERRLGPDELVVWEKKDLEEGFCQVTIMTQDRPGLLSRNAGAFTLHNINILGAQVFTRTSGVALDIFQVEHPPDRVYEEEAWAKVHRDTLRVLTGHMALDYRLARKRPRLTNGTAGPRRPSKVEIDNDTSDFYTIIEVFTHDRLGLLYELTQTLFDLQLSIYVAKISTTVDQVVDVFYVKDFFGEKLYDESQTKELKEALQFTLEK